MSGKAFCDQDKFCSDTHVSTRNTYIHLPACDAPAINSEYYTCVLDTLSCTLGGQPHFVFFVLPQQGSEYSGQIGSTGNYLFNLYTFSS